MAQAKAVPITNEKSKIAINIDIPKTWAEGEQLAFPIKTGLKHRAFVFVTVTPPGGSLEDFVSVDVHHYGDGVYEAKFTPTLTGVHNVIVEIEGGVFNAEYQVDVLKGKKLGRPKIVGFNFRSLCPDHPAVCHVFFPDLIKPTEFIATFASKNGTRKVPITPYKGDWAIEFVPQVSDKTIIISIQSSLKNIHIEGSPIVIHVGPPNPWVACTVGVPPNEPVQKEQFSFQIITPAMTELNDFVLDATINYVDTTTKSSHNFQRSSQKLICHLTQAEIQKSIKLYDPDENIEVIDEEGPVRASSNAGLSPRSKGRKEEKFDGNLSPRSPRGGLPEPKKDKEEKKKEEKEAKEAKKGKTLDTKGKGNKDKVPLPKTLANSQTDKQQGSNPQLPTRPAPNTFGVPKIQFDKAPERPQHAPQRPTSHLPGSVQPEHGDKPNDLFSEIRNAQSVRLKPTAQNVFDENDGSGPGSTPHPKGGRPGAGVRPTNNTRMPTYQRPLTLLPKYMANVEKYVPYTGALKRWDCYFVAEKQGEVVINIYVHGVQVAGGPWKFLVNGESHPFVNGLSWEQFAEKPIFPVEPEQHENAFVVNSRWQNLTEKATLLSFTACSILENGALEEVVLEGQKLSSSGTMEIIPMGKMAGRSARKFILRPKAFSPKVTCVPLFVTVLSGGFTNVSCLTINTTLWKPSPKMLPLFGKAPVTERPEDRAFFVGVFYKDSRGMWGLHPVGEYVIGTIIIKMLGAHLPLIHKFCPAYVNPERLTLKRAPIDSSRYPSLEVTRNGTWDMTTHKNTRQKLLGNSVSFSWTNEVQQVVKDGEEFGGIKNDNGVQSICLKEISHDVKCVLFIDTVKNPIWDVKPLHILTEANIEIFGISPDGSKHEWAHSSFKGGERFSECSSVVEGKLFRNSWTEPWEYVSIHKGGLEEDVESYLNGEFAGYVAAVDPTANDKKKKKEREDKREFAPARVSLKKFLPTDWSQKVNSLRCIVLEVKNVVPLKSTSTTTSLVVDIQSDIVDKDAQKLYRLPKEGYTTGWAKTTKEQCAFWGTVYDFYGIVQCNDAPVKLQVWESHEEKHKNAKVVGSIKLNLVRMFEASEGEGQTVIEQWYKLQPTKEEVEAVRSHGMWWGVQTACVELKLRFIAFSK